MKAMQMKTNYTKIFLTFFNLVFFSVLSYPVDPACSARGIVTWVVDGDTIIVELQNKSEKIRLLGIDTPEFNNREGKTEYYAYEAFTFTRDRLKGKTVCLVKDSGNNRDKFGRLLMYVYLGDECFNKTLIRDGLAEVFHKADFSMKPLFIKLELEAKKSRKGMWRFYREKKQNLKSASK